MTQKLTRPRVPKRFYFLTLMVFIPAFYCLVAIRAHWYGYLVVAASFAGLIAIRLSRFWQGWYAMLCFVLALFAAYMGMSVSRPRWDVSLPGQIGAGTVWLFSHARPEKAPISAQVLDVVSYRVPEGYERSEITLTACTMERFAPAGGGNGWAVLQLHGGAFVDGVSDIYRHMARRYCDLLGGAEVFTPDYRLWPAYAYPSQQNDAMDAWTYITRELGYAAERVVVVGDSAGGNLALSLTLRLRDEGMPLPAGLVCMSPWADLSNSGPSHVENATNDPTFGLEPGEWDGVTPVGVETTYPDGLNAQAPYLSPSFGDYAGFPPMLLQAASAEVLLSDSQMVYDNAVQNGVDCTLTVYPGMFHVFQASLDLFPEGREAWEEIDAFLERVMER